MRASKAEKVLGFSFSVSSWSELRNGTVKTIFLHVNSALQDGTFYAGDWIFLWTAGPISIESAV
jgi:hypothetical protein